MSGPRPSVRGRTASGESMRISNVSRSSHRIGARRGRRISPIATTRTLSTRIFSRGAKLFQIALRRHAPFCYFYLCCHRACDSPRCTTRFCEGRFHESIVVSDCQSPLLLFDEEGACTCRRDGTHALRPGRYQFSALDAGFTFTVSWPRPVRPLPPRGAWAGETHDDRLPLLAAGAGPFPFTPRCLDDRPDLARPAGKKRGTGLFYARTLGFPA
jgi:hypothetical protein